MGFLGVPICAEGPLPESCDEKANETNECQGTPQHEPHTLAVVLPNQCHHRLHNKEEAGDEYGSIVSVGEWLGCFTLGLGRIGGVQGANCCAEINTAASQLRPGEGKCLRNLVVWTVEHIQELRIRHLGDSSLKVWRHHRTCGFSDVFIVSIQVRSVLIAGRAVTLCLSLPGTEHFSRQPAAPNPGITNAEIAW